MGTPPNSGEDEVIPAEANQSSPLGRQKGFTRQKLQICVAAATKGGQASPGPKAMSPGAPPRLETETMGELGNSPEAERGWGCLMSGRGSSSWKNRLGHGQRQPTELYAPRLCTFSYFSSKKDKK